MPHPWTLQKYITREMGRTCVLTAVALTGVLGLGGGILQMVKLDGELTPMQLLRLMWLVLPVAGAMTLPMAALFSATATYGRLSADNEFAACRASGINLHVLLLPTVLLSLICAAVTFGFTNFVVPHLVGDLDRLVGGDYGSFVQQKLNKPKGLTIGDGRRKRHLRADECVVDSANPNRLALGGVTFVESDGGEWVRYGTARELHMQFEPSRTATRLAAEMREMHLFDPREARFDSLVSQEAAIGDVQRILPLEIKFLTLPELLHYLRRPQEWREVAAALVRVRQEQAKRLQVERLLTAWQADRRWSFATGGTTYVIRAGSEPQMTASGDLQLTDVTVDETRDGSHQTIRAGVADVEYARGESVGSDVLQLDLRACVLNDGRAVLERDRVSVGPLPVDAEIVAIVENLPEAELLRALDDAVTAKGGGRSGSVDVLGGAVRRLRATLHERCTFSASVFVLVILGAMMSIAFRGAHVIAAFGISFIPSILVIVAIVTGKQMSQNAATHLAGLALMWGGVLFVAALDVWFLLRVVRR